MTDTYENIETPTEPVDAPTESAADIEARVRAEYETRYAKPDPEPEKPKEEGNPDAYFESLRDLMYDDPVAYQKRIMADSVAAAAATVRKEYEPLLGQYRQNELVQKVGAGLDPTAQGYLRDIGAKLGIDPSQITPEVQDLMTRAARDYGREKAPATPPERPGITVERPVSNAAPTITAQDREIFGPYIKQHGEARFLEMKKGSSGQVFDGLESSSNF